MLVPAAENLTLATRRDLAEQCWCRCFELGKEFELAGSGPEGLSDPVYSKRPGLMAPPALGNNAAKF